ncbi:ubiquitin-associated protein 1-like [Watersipora subatra]|uniref:ubiquitin-associated protein 1-like n=1 Tax=Watersipora subatra TaxID=2589382 RepID=UPI00355BADED
MAGISDPWISMTNASHLVLDGVPMKIPENFRPQQKVKDLLPRDIRVHHRQSKVLNLHYEYKVETEFMKWLEAVEREKLEIAEQKRIKEEAKKKQLERDLELQEALKKQKNAENKAEELSKVVSKPNLKKVALSDVTSTEDTKDTNKNLAVVPIVTDAILLPERASPVTVAASAETSTVIANVNIKDFENLAEDPFDNLELKTINDMQELESVLANSQAHSPKEETSTEKVQPPNGEVQSDSSNGTDRDSPIYQNPQSCISDDSNIYSNLAECQSTLPVKANNFNLKKPPIATPRLNPGSKSHNNLDTSAAVVQYKPASEDVNIIISSADSSVKSAPTLPPPVKPKPTISDKMINREGQQNENKPMRGSAETKVQSLANALSKDLGGAVNRPPGAPKGFSYTAAAPATENTKSNGREEKEVKDIEWPSLELRSPPATPIIAEPPSSYPPSSNPSSLINQSKDPMKQSNDLKKVPPAKQVKQKNSSGHVSPNKGKKQPNTQKAAHSSADGQVVESLLAMGFEKPQIVAAIQHLGSDTKQLAEHLCAVQQLVTHDVKWQSAQQAIFMCGHDLGKAGMFAKGYQQLSEFGFGEDQVKEALISNDMDMQKALDALVS